MEPSLLLKAIAGLIAILGLLVFLLLLPKKTKKDKKVSVTKGTDKPKTKTDLDSLRYIIRNRISSNKQLEEALDLIIKHHGKIAKKLGIRVNPQFDGYMEVLVTLCRHPNTSKEIILKFDKELVNLNPEYKSEINDAITKGLNSRL